MAEKYGWSVSPVRRRTSSSPPSADSSAQVSAVRASCQTRAGATGWPVARSQRTIVSRWFAMPTPATRARSTCESTSPAQLRVAARISAASCSTWPGAGWCWRCSTVASTPRRPSTSTSAVELPRCGEGGKVRRIRRNLVARAGARERPESTLSGHSLAIKRTAAVDPKRPSTAGLAEGVGLDRALAGLSIRTRWQPTRHGPGQPGGNMATKPNAHVWCRNLDGHLP